MIPTPDLSHLTKYDYEHVYEPAGMSYYLALQYTFLLLDALEEEADEIKKDPPLICLEIGSGSGCVSAFLGAILRQLPVVQIATDINPRASLCTLKTGTRNKISIDPITCPLAQPLLNRLRHSVDILLFNPPYVPTGSEEAFDAQTRGDISGAWAGGASGMETTCCFLKDVETLLSDRGKCYLVALNQNDINGICTMMLDEFNLQSKIIMQRRAGREHLFIIRFSRTSNM
ncbi:S-adenosyl-L-methionine-dependent methyltransferase [Hygrophoropsis aurantiaca]|uniref:S-adenosyl-L-methionine-dependent methyltransferase n=1 Tax=Hygrophoropsis aurantiaca TaxID=72124 RepID=A0ACB8ANN6_9AGAM|nr:S-adenosyl-L-methionine-dependent methyltransferase [Hygrophoropsis aurantiaca]